MMGFITFSNGCLNTSTTDTTEVEVVFEFWDGYTYQRRVARPLNGHVNIPFGVEKVVVRPVGRGRCRVGLARECAEEMSFKLNEGACDALEPRPFDELHGKEARPRKKIGRPRTGFRMKRPVRTRFLRRGRRGA